MCVYACPGCSLFPPSVAMVLRFRRGGGEVGLLFWFFGFLKRGGEGWRGRDAGWG